MNGTRDAEDGPGRDRDATGAAGSPGPGEAHLLPWASALCIAGGLLILAGGVVLVPIYHGADLPLGLPTEAMNEQLLSSGKPVWLLAAWATVPGAVATYTGLRMRSVGSEGARFTGWVAIVAGLVSLGPGGGFLWGTILCVLGGSLALAWSRCAR